MQRIAWLVLLIYIHWITIYPVDSVIILYQTLEQPGPGSCASTQISERVRLIMSISTNTALQTNLDSNFLPLLAVCFLRFASCGFLRLDFQLLAVRFSTSCGFLRLDFQLLAFQKFLRVNRKNTTLLRLAAACVFLRRKNFLRHFLRVHYFWAVL